MKITLDLPEYDASPPLDGHDLAPLETLDAAPEGPRPCGHCHQPLTGTAVRFSTFGYIHADTCLQKVVDIVTGQHMSERSRYITAWLAVAAHVAKHPSRHSAATIRAVLENLCRIAGWAPR